MLGLGVSRSLWTQVCILLAVYYCKISVEIRAICICVALRYDRCELVLTGLLGHLVPVVAKLALVYIWKSPFRGVRARVNRGECVYVYVSVCVCIVFRKKKKIDQVV